MRRRLACVVGAVAVLSCAGRAAAAGADYPAGFRPCVATGTAVETEVNRLIASPGYVHGFFVNAEDRFFYAGDTAAFNAFLRQYAEMKTGVVAHRLTIHPGKGVAKSPWDKGEGKPCDWRLDVCPLGWREGHSATRNETRAVPVEAGAKPYVVEVNVWAEGKVDLAAVEIPRNVEVVGRLPSPPAGYRTDVTVTPADEPHAYFVNFRIIEAGKDGKDTAVMVPRLLLKAGAQGQAKLVVGEWVDADGATRSESMVVCTARVQETVTGLDVTTNIVLKVKGVEKLNTSHTVSLNLAGTAQVQ